MIHAMLMLMVHACKWQILLLIQVQIYDSKIQIKILLIFPYQMYEIPLWNTIWNAMWKGYHVHIQWLSPTKIIQGKWTQT